MIRNSVQKSKVQIRERSESPFSMYKSAASTAAQSDSCSQMSDVEEFNFVPQQVLPIVMEKGESVFERQNTSECKPVTEESFQKNIANLTDKCQRQAAEVEKVEQARLMADYCIEDCKRTMDRINNFIDQGREDLNHQANVIMYGAHHTVKADGTVKMSLKDSHTFGGIMAQEFQKELREQARDEANHLRITPKVNGRAERDARAAMRSTRGFSNNSRRSGSAQSRRSDSNQSRQ